MEGYANINPKILTLWNSVFTKEIDKKNFEDVLATLSKNWDLYSTQKISNLVRVFETRWINEAETDKLVHTKILDFNTQNIIKLKEYIQGNYIIEVIPINIDDAFSWWVDENFDFCFYSSLTISNPIKVIILVYNIATT